MTTRKRPVLVGAAFLTAGCDEHVQVGERRPARIGPVVEEPFDQQQSAGSAEAATAGTQNAGRLGVGPIVVGAFPAGTPDFVATSLLETMSPAAAVVEPSSDVATLTGRAPRSFRDWATENAPEHT